MDAFAHSGSPRRVGESCRDVEFQPSWLTLKLTVSLKLRGSSGSLGDIGIYERVSTIFCLYIYIYIYIERERDINLIDPTA